MKRRDFIGSMLSLGPAIALTNSLSLTEAADMEINNAADVIVVGGSLAGCLAAMKAARENQKVILIESRTYLGTDITATLRPWIQSKNIGSLNEDLQEVLFNSKLPHDENVEEYPLQVGAIKKNLVRKLREAGVEILFMSELAGVLTEEEKVTGVVIGNKSGLQSILAKTVIDATEIATAVFLSGAKRNVSKPEFKVQRVAEFLTVGKPANNYIDVPSELGLKDNRVWLHRGKHDDTHYYIEFHLPVKSNDASYKEKARWEVEARKKTIELCEYLIANVTAFKEAVLLQTSPELWYPDYWTMKDINQETGEVQSCKNLFRISRNYVWHEKLDVDQLNNMQSAVDQLTEIVIDRIANIHEISESNNVIRMGGFEIPLHSLKPETCCDHRFQLRYYSLQLPDIDTLPEMDTSNVLVVGGGTAGAPAAISASRELDRVILVEPTNGLGGTGTIGGINSYYHGYRGGFTAELNKKVTQMAKRISTYHKMSHWNVEVKMMTYFDEIVNNGGFIYYRTQAVGTHVEDKKLQAIITLNSDGLSSIRSNVTIDGTGDGDLAAWSRVPCYVGDEKDGNLQTFNQCNWRLTKKMVGVNLDIGVIDKTQTLDSTRGLFIGHKNGNRYDFSPYLSARESRHMIGDYQLQVSDVFSRQRFPDSIAIGKTDYDQHGLQNSLFARLGYIPYHRDSHIVRVPYRACLPKGIEGLYVIGKAFSAESDAFCFMRMQADMQNLGYAIGLAASAAGKNGESIRRINIKKIQEKLIEKGILKPEDIGTFTELPPAKELVASLNESKESALLPALCTKRSEILPLLEAAYPTAAAQGKMYLAMALAWFGSKTGVEELIVRLDALKDNPQTGKYDRHNRPRGGFLGEPNVYWRVNQLIVLLGLAGDDRAVNLLSNITAHTEAGGPQQSNPRLHWRRVPNYDRIVSLCFSLERFASNKSVRALETLLERPHISGFVAKSGIDGEEKYISAYLEVIIARTLAKCGGKAGLMLLADYVEDIRSVLSDHAYEVLKTITGKDFGKNSEAWKEALSRYPATFSGN